MKLIPSLTFIHDLDIADYRDLPHFASKRHPFLLFEMTCDRVSFFGSIMNLMDIMDSQLYLRKYRIQHSQLHILHSTDDSVTTGAVLLKLC